MKTTSKMKTFSCKDDCTLTKHTRRWTYSALRHFFSSIATFSHRRSAQIKKLILQKLIGAPKPMGRHLSRPRRQFWGPLLAILDFAGITGGERLPPSLLGWYLVYKCPYFCQAQFQLASSVPVELKATLLFQLTTTTGTHT